MVTLVNTYEGTCCISPTAEGMEVAAGFDDRSVTVWPADGKASAGVGAGTETKGEGGGRGGGFEDDLPVKLVGHTKPVFSVSWSPDRQTLLTAGGGGAVRLWDLGKDSRGESLACFRGHR
ncbi:unnamed protein product [Discosporangium mesarthrocarpum]